MPNPLGFEDEAERRERLRLQHQDRSAARTFSHQEILCRLAEPLNARIHALLQEYALLAYAQLPHKKVEHNFIDAWSIIGGPSDRPEDLYLLLIVRLVLKGYYPAQKGEQPSHHSLVVQAGPRRPSDWTRIQNWTGPRDGRHLDALCKQLENQTNLRVLRIK
jgi:hypothetical protein